MRKFESGELVAVSRAVASLLLGVYDSHGLLQAAGSVGTIWDTATASALRKQLASIEIKVCPFDAENAPKKGAGVAGR